MDQEEIISWIPLSLEFPPSQETKILSQKAYVNFKKDKTILIKCLNSVE